MQNISLWPYCVSTPLSALRTDPRAAEELLEAKGSSDKTYKTPISDDFRPSETHFPEDYLTSCRSWNSDMSSRMKPWMEIKFVSMRQEAGKGPRPDPSTILGLQMCHIIKLHILPSLCLLLPTFPQDTFIFYLNKAKSHLCPYENVQTVPSSWQLLQVLLSHYLQLPPYPHSQRFHVCPAMKPLSSRSGSLAVWVEQAGMAKVSTTSRDGEDMKGGSPQCSSAVQGYVPLTLLYS